MSTEPHDASTGAGDALADALRLYMEHRAQGSGASDTQLLERNPKLRELLEPLLEQDPQVVDVIRPGGVLGDFRLIEPIGRGGMGEVWEAEQISLRRRVALKLLRAHVFASTHSIGRFRREALAGARLKHPCIVSVYAVGESNDVQFIAQELIESRRTLSSFVREARELPAIPADHWRKVARIFAQLADALQLAHENGVIHRDLKPSNVLITKDGTPKIADFGLALVAGECDLSRTGDLSGSPFYMSPEQAAAKRVVVDERSDVFSLGATMFEALTLQRPFEGDTVAQVLTKILFHDPRDPRELRSLCPRDLAVICMKMLEKAPTRRYPSMRAVADELERFLRHEPIRARPPGIIGRSVKWSRRHPVLASSSAIVCVSLAILSALFFETLRARDAAEKSALEARTSAIAEAQAARDAHESAAAARLEAKTSARVVDFLVDAFLESDPSRALGRELSAREVLDRGVKNIQAGLREPAEAGLRARLLDSLGSVYARLGLSAQAERLLREARALATSAFGPDAQRTLEIRAELGRLYAENKRHAEAIAEFVAVVELCVARYGAESVLALRLEGELGGVLLRADEYERAEPHLRHSIEGLQKQGEYCAPALFTLSQVREATGHFKEAGLLLHEALEGYTDKNGPDDPGTLDVLDGLAKHELLSGRDEEAGKLARQAAASRFCVFGPKHPSTLESLGMTAYIESARRPDDSIDTLATVRATCLSELGPDHATTLMLSRYLTGALVQQERFAEAEPELLDAMARAPRDPRTAMIEDTSLMYTLGQVEWGLGQRELGLGLLEEIIAVAQANPAASDPNLDAFAAEACGMYEKLERFDQALQLAKYRLSILPPNHPARAQVNADILRFDALVQGR